MGRQEGEQLYIKVTHCFASTLYLIDCSETWKRATADVLSHPLSAGRYSAAGEAEDCTSRIWSSYKVETAFQCSSK